MKALFTFTDPPTAHDLHLSTEHAASSYGLPVVVNEAGEAIDLASWALYRVIWASDPELAAFKAAGYPVRWGLTFTVHLPTCPSYWGSACDAVTAERACVAAEAAIRGFIGETWPGAAYEFRRWAEDGGLPPVTCEPGGRGSVDASRLARFIARTWTEWAQWAASGSDLGNPPTHGPGDPHSGEKAWLQFAGRCSVHAANAAGRLANRLKVLASRYGAEGAADDLTRSWRAEAVRQASEEVGEAWRELFATMRAMEDWHEWPLVPEEATDAPS